MTQPQSHPQSRPPIALVTGGSRGLGKNMAQKLARNGIDVIFTYHSNQAEAEALVAELTALGRRAAALQLDAGRIASFPAFADAVRGGVLAQWQRERFDYLVNNAGIGIHASLAEMTETQFDDLMNVHFKGVFFLTQALLPLMADGGRIVNISSG